MAEKVSIWFDAEADFPEVRFSDKPGFMRETKNDAVMEDKGDGFRAGLGAGAL